MKKINYILVLLFLLSGCNYEPIYKSKDTNFTIISFEIKDKNSLTSQITRSLRTYNSSEGSRQYDLKIEAKKSKIVTSKDSRGNIKSYRLIIECNYEIFEKNEKIKSKKIVESFNFNNTDNKFKLRKYEVSIEKDLMSKIIDNLIFDLYSL